MAVEMFGSIDNLNLKCWLNLKSNQITEQLLFRKLADLIKQLKLQLLTYSRMQ